MPHLFFESIYDDFVVKLFAYVHSKTFPKPVGLFRAESGGKARPPFWQAGKPLQTHSAVRSGVEPPSALPRRLAVLGGWPTPAALAPPAVVRNVDSGAQTQTNGTRILGEEPSSSVF